MPNAEIALRVRDVSKHYLLFERPEHRLKQSIVWRVQRLLGGAPRAYFRDFTALRDVSFDIRRGETVGIVGRNGSGKSTLLQIICGTLRPSGGAVETRGVISALLELGAGFNPDFTGRENVFMNGAILGMSRDDIEARMDDIAAFADIGVFLDQPVKTYSSGMFVRLAFAVAVSVDPDILVVDEALAVGDEAFQRKCYARIEEIQSRGAAVLFVSHAAQTIMQICSRALLFDHGRLLMDGAPKDVIARYQRLLVQADAGAPSGEAGAHGERDARGERGWWDEDLRPESTVEMGNGAAAIVDVRLLDAAGRRVNVVRAGERVTYAYDVQFAQDASDVSVGMMLKTVSGVALAGLNNEPQGLRWRRVRAGETIRVEFSFTCALLPGVYFTNAGVVAEGDSERVTLHRIMDAAAFRVAAREETGEVGFFSLDTELRINGAACHGANPPMSEAANG